MSFDDDYLLRLGHASRAETPAVEEPDEERPRLAPGKRTLTSQLGWRGRAAGPSPGKLTRSSRLRRPGEVPYRAQMEALFGESFAGVQSHTGESEVLAPLGARAAAEGDRVAFAQPNPSPALVAHELTHVVQQRRAASASLAASRPLSSSSDAAEVEADAIAAQVAAFGFSGPPVSVNAAPSARVHLDKGNADDTPKKDPLVLDGRDLAVIGDASNPRIVVGARWLRRNGVKRGYVGYVQGDAHPKILQRVIKELMPLYPWSVEREESPLTFAKSVGFRVNESLWKRGEQRLRLGRTMFTVFGLPPSAPVQAFPWRDGIEVYADTTYTYPQGEADAHTNRVARRAVAERILLAIEKELGAPIEGSARTAFRTKLVSHLSGPAQDSVVVVRLDAKLLASSFGDEALRAYMGKDTDGKKGDKEGAVISLPGGPVDLSLAKKEERKKLASLLEEIFGKADKVSDATKANILVPRDIKALLELDADDNRNELIAHIKKMLKDGGDPDAHTKWNAARIYDVVQNARASWRASRAENDLGVTHKSKAGDGIMPYPVPGEIRNLSGHLNTGMKAHFGFRPRYGTDIRENVQYVVSSVNIKWYAAELDTDGKTPTGKVVGRESTNFIDSKEDGWLNDRQFEQTFKTAGKYKIHAFVDHAWFQPNHFEIVVEVLTEADRLRRMESMQAEGFGQETSRKAYNFNAINNDSNSTSILDVFLRGGFGPDKDDEYAKGSRAEGRLNFEHAASPHVGAMNERDKLRAEITELERLKDHYPGDDRRSKAFRKYADNRIRRLSRSLGRVNDIVDREDPDSRAVTVQGNYASRTHGVPSGPLRLVSAFKKRTNGPYKGTLLDHSEIVRSEHFRFRASDSAYEAMMEKLFIDLTKAYPDGSISFAFQLYENDQPTEKFVRFTRVTDTSEKDFREVAYSNKAQVAVNLFALLLSLFPPTAPIGIGLAVVYNGYDLIKTIQDDMRTDTLQASRLIDVGLLALDLIPILGAASKTIRISGKAYRVLEATQFLGDVYLMSEEASTQIGQLRDGLISQLAKKTQELQRLQGLNDSDPAVHTLKLEIQQLENKIKSSAATILKDMVAQQGLQMASQAIVRRIAGKYVTGTPDGTDPTDTATTSRSGTRGADVYTRNERALTPAMLKNALGDMGEGYARGDAKFNGRDLLRIKFPDGSKAKVRVEVELKPDADMGAERGHGGDAGPGELVLTPPASNGDKWQATILVSSSVRKRDLAHVIGHELDEAAEIVRRHHGSKGTVDIDKEQKAGLFKPGGDPAATATAHDVAAAQELNSLFTAANDATTRYNDAKRKQASEGVAVDPRLVRAYATHIGRLQRALKAMGLDDADLHANRMALVRKHASDPDALARFIDAYRKDKAGQLPEASEYVGKHVLTDGQRREITAAGADSTKADRALGKGVPGPDLVEITKKAGEKGLDALNALLDGKAQPAAATALVLEAKKRGVLDKLSGPAVDGTIGRLLHGKLQAGEVLDLLGKHPARELQAISHAVGAAPGTRVNVKTAERIVATAKEIGHFDTVHTLLTSGNLTNPSSLLKHLNGIFDELTQTPPQRGALRELQLATELSKSGNVTLGGQADISTSTAGGTKQAYQSKSVASEKSSAMADNAYAAVTQLRGKKGEKPEAGSERIAYIVIENPANPMYAANKRDIIAVLRGQPAEFAGLRTLQPDGTVGWERIRVKGASTIDIEPADL